MRRRKKAPTTTPTPAPAPEPTSGTILLADNFARPRSVITNQYAHDHTPYPGATWSAPPGLILDDKWDIYNGTLYTGGDTGVPDEGPVDIDSRAANGNAILRARTKRDDLHNIAVSFDLRIDYLRSQGVQQPPVDWDGCHVFLRAQPLVRGVGCTHLYYFSCARRDGVVMFKKKIPGGDTAGGTYYSLNPEIKGAHPIPYGVTRRITTSIHTRTDGATVLQGWIDGNLVCMAIDDGTIGGPPLDLPGATGIRGDNACMNIGNLEVRAA